MSTSIAATRPERLGPAFVTLFLMATGMTTLGIAGTVPILPMLQAHFAALPMASALSRATFTIGAIGIVVGAPLTSFAVSWFGRKRVLVGAACLFTLAGVSGYFIDNLPVIVASRFVVGLTAALTTTLTTTIVAEAFGEAERNRWMGIMVGCGTLLAMTLLPLIGVLGDIDWRNSFLLHLIGVPIALLAWLGYREAPAPAGARSAAAAFRVRLDLIALGLCVGIAVNSQSSYIPFKLYSIGVHSAAVVGFAMMPLTLAAALVSPLYGRLRKVATGALVFGLGFAGLAVGLSIFVLATTLTVALCGYALFGAAMGLVVANLYAVGSHSDDPQHRGTGLGQALSAYYAAPLVAQIVLEPLSSGQPVRALMCLAGFCALMCVTWLTFVARRARAPQRVVNA